MVFYTDIHINFFLSEDESAIVIKKIPIPLPKNLNPEDGDNMLHRNIYIGLQKYTGSQFERQHCEVSPHVETSELIQ
jgi:hypothetical protein